MGQFQATVAGWVRDVEGASEAVWRQATARMVETMKVPVGAGGSMPVVTSFLQNSLQASTASMPTIDPTARPKGPVSSTQGSVEAVIGSAPFGSEIYFGFTAAYALRVNYGFQGEDSLGRTYNQSGRHFVENAVSQWQQIVDDVSAELFRRLGLEMG